ncbi:uncharacterized protein [Manis javanica]|uniref:uncharacterized protein n=1 Tax=Manis javanica TaxID=9974 RepID=UPI003C6CE184
MTENHCLKNHEFSVSSVSSNLWTLPFSEGLLGTAQRPGTPGGLLQALSSSNWGSDATGHGVGRLRAGSRSFRNSQGAAVQNWWLREDAFSSRPGSSIAHSAARKAVRARPRPRGPVPGPRGAGRGARRPGPRLPVRTGGPPACPDAVPGPPPWPPGLGPRPGRSHPPSGGAGSPGPAAAAGTGVPGGPIPDGARPGPGCGLACGTPADLPPEAAALARDALPPRLASTLTGGGGPEGSEPGALHLWARRAPACRRAPPQASSGKYPAENTLLETEEILLGRIPPSSPSLPRLLPSPREKGNSTSTPGRELWFPQAFPNPH